MKIEEYNSNKNLPYRVLITGGSGFIGTNLIAYLLDNYPNYALINIDFSPPKLENHNKYWEDCDIKEEGSLLDIFKEFNPTHVIHLAAKASLKGQSIEDFPDNIIGTQNIVSCINETPTVDIFLHTSTQYVTTPGKFPESEVDFSPYTVYGASKAESEKIVRKSNLKCKWVILRPTNIWGPWHSFFPYELWPYLSKRLYFHPGGRPIRKHYGFVGNSVKQIGRILHIEDNKYFNQVYYITDSPIDNAEWMNAFSIALCGNDIRRIPRTVWKTLSFIGDIMKSVCINFPIDSERYFRLTVDEYLPYQKTINLVGTPSFSLNEGVSICVDWINKYHPNLLRVSN